MTCHDVEARDLAAAYAHGRLGDEDRDAFEQHYVGCPACFDALQTYRVLHGVLVRRAAPARRISWGVAWVGLVAAAALAVAVATTLRSNRAIAPTVSSPPQAAAPLAPAVSAPSSVPAQSGNERTERIQLLARFEPPRYEPPALRGAEDPARRRFASAMEPYRAGDFAGAAEALRREVESGTPSAEATFYLAVSELQTGHIAEAISGFERVVSMNDLLFEEDAHFFAGKAFLRLGDVSRARAEVAKVVALKGDREAEARRLLSGLDTLPPR